jgi:hypothetical protein
VEMDAAVTNRARNSTCEEDCNIRVSYAVRIGLVCMRNPNFRCVMQPYAILRVCPPPARSIAPKLPVILRWCV